jgi:hypothetical protein
LIRPGHHALAVSLDGDVSLVRSGRTTVLGLEWHRGHLYAPE